MQIARGAVGFMLPVRGYADRYTKSRLFCEPVWDGAGECRHDSAAVWPVGKMPPRSPENTVRYTPFPVTRFAMHRNGKKRRFAPLSSGFL